MISQNKISVNGQHKVNESALRHRVRNLRAKVKLLLPMDLCCKYEKRSKLLMRMQNHKESQGNCCNHRWNHSRQHSTEFFIPELSSKLKINQFNKLTNQQIQQIKEDKLYYVGQEFIDQFDTFLDNRQKQRMHKNVLQMKSSKNINREKCEHQHVLKTADSQAFIQKVKYVEELGTLERLIKKSSKKENLEEKRKMVQEESASRRLFIRIRRNQKDKKHEENFTQIQKSREGYMKNRRNKQELKLIQVFKKKKNCEQTGQIVSLSEKLRDLCLHRFSKSANLLYRY